MSKNDANMSTEYIGSLEGEIAGKNSEINTLKAENRQLLEENNRLTDLTRMLLSSQAFSGFLSELSQNGMPAPTTTAPSQPKPQPTRKDVNPNHAVRQMNHNAQVGLTMIPEQTIDFTSFDSNSWNSGITNDYAVFAVMELPQGPSIDTLVLSGKSTELESVESQKELPSLPDLPILSKVIEPELVSVDESVYVDSQISALFEPSSAPTVHVPSIIVTPVTSEKESRYVLVSQPRNSDDDWKLFEKACSKLDSAAERISAITSALL